MKAHTSEFKNQIKQFGRELDSKITYTLNNEEIELGNEELNSVSQHYEGAILKSVMKQLDIDSNVEIPVGTILTYQFGVKIGNEYEYINYGNFVVYSAEKQEDTNSYKITCYDKMLYAMKDYTNIGIRYPLTVRNYLLAICEKIGLTYDGNQFPNQDMVINNELYLDTDGRSMGYTFRDVLDELAQVSGGTICINENDELEIRYIDYALNDKPVALRISHATYQGISFTVNQGSNIITINGQYTGQHDGDAISFGIFLVEPLEIKNEVIVSFNNAITTDKIKISLIYENTSSSYFILDKVNKKIKLQIENEKIRGIAFEFLSPTPRFTNFKITLQVGEIEEIDEEYLKDINVNFGKKYGPVNTLVLSRGGDGDKISLSIPSDLADEDKIAIQITDNQIMNDNDRADYMEGILSKLYGLEYYANDFSSTGVCYLDLCDKYKVKIGDVSYECVMFNDEINITQGLEEMIYTDMPDESKQEYQYMSSNDRGITQANIIAKKSEATILEYTQRLDDANNRIDAVETKQTATDRTISILSTNIDSTTGDVNAVTTKEKRFTFNDSGLNISSSDNTFTSRIDEQGVFFEDGNARVAEYTKDGSKQKDLQLFGVYYYGMEDINDTPMFVAQLYTDDNGDECVGHFYNGGDY